jgi:hypothetical protein
LVRESSNSSLKQQATASVFNSKEATEFLAARVTAAQELQKKFADTEKNPVFVYQGEQRAWGGTRPFNPVKDDFLQLVEMAIDAYKQNSGDN